MKYPYRPIPKILCDACDFVIDNPDEAYMIEDGVWHCEDCASIFGTYGHETEADRDCRELHEEREN